MLAIVRGLSSSRRRPRLVAVLAGLGAYALLLAIGDKLLNDPDTFWHIAAGRWVIEHHAIPFQDPFSQSLHGQRWVPHEWLSEIAFAAAYGQFGWAGIVAATALAFAVAMAVMMRALLNWYPPRYAIVGLATAFVLAAGHLSARPHVLAMPLMVTWMAGLVEARSRQRAPSFIMLPVMALWANLHGGFAVGLVFCLLFGTEAVIQAPRARRLDAAKRWGLFLCLAIASAIISPNGLDGLLYPLRLVGMVTLPAIVEWHAADFQHFKALEVAILVMLLVGYSFGLRLPVSRTAMVVLLVHMALQHERNSELLGLLAPLLIAEPLARQLGFHGYDRLGSGEHDDSPAAQRLRIAVLAAGGAAASLLAVFLAGATFGAHNAHPKEQVTPAAALKAVTAMSITGPVLNSYDFGGYLIFSGIPPFIDGRADLYGDRFMAEYADMVDAVGDALPRALEQYAIAWTLFRPSDPAATLLDHLPAWRRVYSDDVAVVHVRKAPGPHPSP